MVNVDAMPSSATDDNHRTPGGTAADVFVAEGDGERPASLDRPEPTFPGQPAKRRRTITMPDLGLGTWELDDDTAEKMVRAALDLGVRHIDTAQMYGNEDAVGRAIAASGIGRDGGDWSFEFYMEQKHIGLALGQHAIPKLGAN